MSKTIYNMKHLPNCDLCGNPSGWDSPIKIAGGSWGYLCDSEFNAMYPNGNSLATRFSTDEEPELSDSDRSAQIREAIFDGDLDLAEELIGDGDIFEWI